MKPPVGKKKGFALLLDASDKGPPSSKRPNDMAKPADSGDTEPDGDEDLSDLDDLGSDLGDDLPGDDADEDPLAASSDDGSGDGMGDPGQIDPEVAGLAARLGFHQPHQQQALIDLIQLVTGPGLGGPSSGSSSPAPSPLPESSY